ncbi:uncharacterized protein LOC126782884 [Argentina anserina]|uniref:uncharacterized protein LOC126782884 n=1 Tax=Argentina anserina TaxID=57926 RepID=UPI00217662F5|nr:uncharacterized protein LOC126782884 [Potentilla anserina]
MDLDDLDGPSKPARVSRFIPRSKNAPPRPKPEPAVKKEPSKPVPKSDPKTPQLLQPKPEALDDAAEKKEEKQEEACADGDDSNGAVKMETGEEPTVEDDDPLEEDDDEDVVVREIDVFFNPNVDSSTQLYVLQYPLRPRWRPYELENRCEEIRVKPGTAEVEVDLSIDLYSKNCDQEFADRLKMTKQTLATEWGPCRSTGYAVGVLMGNKLHLNPVHAVVQLRPSLDHLKPGGSKRKGRVTGDVELTVKRENVSEGNFLPSSKKQSKRVESSTEDEESWVPLQYHGSESDFSARYLKRMVAQDISPIDFTMTPYDYVNSLCPRTCKGSSKRALLNLPLEERIQTLLVKEPVARRFSDLKKYYAPRNQDKELLDVLQKNGLLLRDLWVPKTALLYPKKEGSSRKKEDDNLRTARNFILNSFKKNPVISYSELNVYPRLKPHFDETLRFLAVYRPSTRDWKLKEQSDVSFAELYPEIHESQEQIWERMDKQLVEALKPHRDLKNASISKIGKSPYFDKGPSESASRIPSGGVRTISDETRAALPHFIKEVFKKYKVCNLQLIRDGLSKLTVEEFNMPKNDPKSKMLIAAKNASEAPLEVIQNFVTQVAIEIGGVYVLKSSPEHPEHDQLRNVVIKLLQGKNKGPLKKLDVTIAAQEELGREITNNEYSKVMNDICVSKGSQWYLRTGDGGPK